MSSNHLTSSSYLRLKSVRELSLDHIARTLDRHFSILGFNASVKPFSNWTDCCHITSREKRDGQNESGQASGSNDDVSNDKFVSEGWIVLVVG